MYHKCFHRKRDHNLFAQNRIIRSEVSFIFLHARTFLGYVQYSKIKKDYWICRGEENSRKKMRRSPPINGEIQNHCSDICSKYGTAHTSPSHSIDALSFSFSLVLSRSTSLSDPVSVAPEIPALTGCPRLSLFHRRSSAWPISPLPFIPKHLSGEFVNFRHDQHRVEPRNEVL